MVFLSTLQVLFGRNLVRSVFAFGYRPLTQRMLLEEVVMGWTLIFPLSLVCAHLTIRLAAAGWRPFFVRSDVWTTLFVTIVGDLYLEVLLPSLQCLPLPEEDLSYALWLQRSWGFQCPDVVPSESDRGHLLSPDAVGTLLTIRLVFMCIGVYLGESFIPIALTGGIACGKSTVAQLLVGPKAALGSNKDSGNASATNMMTSTGTYHGSSKSKKSRRKSKTTPAATYTNSNNSSDDPNLPDPLFADSSQEDEEEGSFFLIDADRIAHEILLPPAVLAAGPHYTVDPNDSVYDKVVQTFSGLQILDNDGWIDRRKLGAVIFPDATRRRQLNRLTHPRILAILLKRLIRGSFWSSQDVVCADIPLLFESGQLRRLFGLTIVVACDPAIQLERLKARNPDLTETQCQERIASQIPIAEKVKKADFVIWNNGDLNDLAKQVEQTRRDVMGRMYGIGMSLLQMLLLVGGSLSLAVSSKLFANVWT